MKRSVLSMVLPPSMILLFHLSAQPLAMHRLVIEMAMQNGDVVRLLKTHVSWPSHMFMQCYLSVFQVFLAYIVHY